MRLTRVHVAAKLAAGALVQLPAGAAQHLVRVLRLQAGAALILFNGEGGEHEAVVESIRRDAVAVRVGAHHAIEREPALHVTLLQGIARGEKMDLILQKATELGVARIVPVAAARSNVRLTPDTAARKHQHWQAVVTSACEQCGRNRVPPVDVPQSLAAAVQAAAAGTRLLLAADEQAAGLPDVLAQHGADDPLTLLIGPEGGLGPEEVRTARLAGFTACRLGPRVLRTETAGLAALAALQALAGDFRSPSRS
jgi:16S rRNA (uracil1498-N3)-methyltransferase